MKEVIFAIILAVLYIFSLNNWHIHYCSTKIARKWWWGRAGNRSLMNLLSLFIP